MTADQKFFLTANLTGSLGPGRMEGMEKLEQFGGLCAAPPVLSREELADRLCFLGAHDHAAAVRLMGPDAKFRLISEGASIVGDDWESVSCRFLLDPSLDRGRVVISKNQNVIAMAPTVEALAIVSRAVVVGEELRAHPDTMPHVRRWIIADTKRRAGL